MISIDTFERYLKHFPFAFSNLDATAHEKLFVPLRCIN